MSALFVAVFCLHQLLPPPKQISYSLCSRGHGLTLSAMPSEFMRKNFLYRMLYIDIYINVIVVITESYYYYLWNCVDGFTLPVFCVLISFYFQFYRYLL